MEILNSNSNKNIILNAESNFIMNVGWEDNVKQYENDILQTLINPKLNFETTRFGHDSYISVNGVKQDNIWFYFYFYSDSGMTHDGGLNYEYAGLSLEKNSKLSVDTYESFFRLDFYKIPLLSDNTLDYLNKRLVFTKNLRVPLGEKVYYSSIYDSVYVPIFMGSNYKNEENMYIYWFMNDNILSDPNLTGNTFYMTAKYYNAVDGTIIDFTKNDMTINDKSTESGDTYYTVTINRNNNTYIITGSGRFGTSDNPIKFYEKTGGVEIIYNSQGNIPESTYGIWKGNILTSALPYDGCGLYVPYITYYTINQTIDTGTIIYVDNLLTTPFVGNNEWLSLSLNGVGDIYTYQINDSGEVLNILQCNVPPILDTINVTLDNYDLTLAYISCGNIDSDGDLLSKGVCWSTGSTPTTGDTFTNNGDSINDFIATISGLSENTTYYFRSYAVNSYGIGYGNILSVTTYSYGAPLVSLYNIRVTDTDELTMDSAISGGGLPILDKGILYGVSGLTDNRVSVGSGFDSYSTTISLFNQEDDYSLKAYAFNSTYTGYSSTEIFEYTGITKTDITVSVAYNTGTNLPPTVPTSFEFTTNIYEKPINDVIVNYLAINGLMSLSDEFTITNSDWIDNGVNYKYFKTYNVIYNYYDFDYNAMSGENIKTMTLGSYSHITQNVFLNQDFVNYYVSGSTAITGITIEDIEYICESSPEPSYIRFTGSTSGITADLIGYSYVYPYSGTTLLPYILNQFTPDFNLETRKIINVDELQGYPTGTYDLTWVMVQPVISISGGTYTITTPSCD